MMHGQENIKLLSQCYSNCVPRDPVLLCCARKGSARKCQWLQNLPSSFN